MSLTNRSLATVDIHFVLYTLVVIREDFTFTSELSSFFAIRPPISKTIQQPPSKVYQCLDPRCRTKIPLKHFANHSPDFYQGSNSAKCGLDSRHQSPLKRSSFETQQHIGHQKHVTEA